MYSIYCYINKVIVSGKGVESIMIKPTGRSRVEGEDMSCLGFDSGNDDVAWFPLEFTIHGEMKEAVLMARIYGKEIELKIESPTELAVKEVVV